LRKILLAATALAALAGSAHAAGNQLPMTGLNAGSFSGSSASIGNPGGVPTSVTSLGALQNGETHVVTSGNASSQTTLGLTGSTSNSNSTGSVSFTTDGTLGQQERPGVHLGWRHRQRDASDPVRAGDRHLCQRQLGSFGPVAVDR
jgi:hypothetical protein